MLPFLWIIRDWYFQFRRLSPCWNSVITVSFQQPSLSSLLCTIIPHKVPDNRIKKSGRNRSICFKFNNSFTLSRWKYSRSTEITGNKESRSHSVEWKVFCRWEISFLDFWKIFREIEWSNRSLYSRSNSNGDQNMKTRKKDCVTISCSKQPG